MPALSSTERPYTGQDYTGKIFGRLTVVELVGFYRSANRPNQRHPEWLCRCECGATITVTGGRLHSRNTSSCGCLRKEQLAKRATKHGYKPQNSAPHHLYWRWQGMISRCIQPKNKAYKHYGGRGIKVCARWREFPEFLKDMEAGWSEGMTIERRDTNSHYCCGRCEECKANGWAENVTWATWTEQRNNMRRNIFLQHDGQRMTVTQWAAKLGIKRCVISTRKSKGLTDAECLSTINGTTGKPLSP
jgi:hypothetical protein